ncbi:hypothetical protein C8J57DRAFT_1212984 [Mycena rebaudengoi]|nr:hypothetical protein C8J57DRAFT_1212984 [Mycena rebaudengoi]
MPLARRVRVACIQLLPGIAGKGSVVADRGMQGSPEEEFTVQTYTRRSCGGRWAKKDPLRDPAVAFLGIPHHAAENSQKLILGGIGSGRSFRDRLGTGRPISLMKTVSVCSVFVVKYGTTTDVV